MTAHDAIVYASGSTAGNHNILVGSNIRASRAAQYNTVLGENISIMTGVQNATSLGQRNATLSESDTFTIGEFLKYREQSRQLDLAGGLVSADERSGAVGLGPQRRVLIDNNNTSIDSPMTLRGIDYSWKFAVEQSGDDANAQDLVMRAADGSAVVFCAGAALEKSQSADEDPSGVPYPLMNDSDGEKFWQFRVEPSEDEEGAQDFVMRASDGTAVVFCSGASQLIPTSG